MGTVDRKIHFFKVEAHQVTVGSNDLTAHTNPHGVLFHIGNLPCIAYDVNSRYLELHNNDVLLMEIEPTSTNAVIKGRIAISRRSALPELEQLGVLSPLSIPTNSGLAEVTHFIYYPLEGTLGLEFNFYGPRAGALRDYILDKSRGFTIPVEYMSLTPILNGDVENQLSKIGDVSIIQIEMARNAIEEAGKLDDNLKDAFSAAAAINSQAESVEVVLRKKKRSRTGFGFPFPRQKTKEFLSDQSVRDAINRFKVYGINVQNNEATSFDLLQDKLVSTKRVVTLDKRRTVESTSMFQAIQAAYGELHDQIVRNDARNNH